MAISLKGSVKKKSAAEDQPIITIYGVPKIGKSSLAAEFPRPVFIQTAAGESVPAGIVADTIEVRNYNDLCEAIGALVNEEHSYATAIFDSTTGLENIIRAEACARNGWKTIEEPGYGKGYKIAATIFLEYIDGIMTLRSLRQMAVVQLGHCDISRFESPTTDPYSRYRVNLHKDAADIIEANSDVIAFLNFKASIKKVDAGFNKQLTHAEGGGTRWMFLEERPGFIAGNRFSMPAEMQFKKGEGYSALAKYLPAPLAEAA
ncbi:ATP-binding protein [Bradyrhizobium elkanii]|uniref:ATP-binding protein n=1 Tax=Bradyrhizobium elkanii TaxID=29448 RepID=UPI00272969EE|nr:ATP-binding protein [Bradyrhizobium elkanii]WLA86859.1 ATP-binding protein [Bradyrhizobium elkanii]